MKPSNPEPTPEADEKGRQYEQEAVGWLRSKRATGQIDDFLIPDAVVLQHGTAVCVEFKCQEAFEAPPFDGHGLPVRQVENYEALRNATGIRTKLIIKDGDYTYRAYIDELEQGRKFDTSGARKHVRRIYPLINFDRWPPKDEAQ